MQQIISFDDQTHGSETPLSNKREEYTNSQALRVKSAKNIAPISYLIHKSWFYS
jgi:hypothetical protein